MSGPESVDHVPSRPSWNCRACSEPWPCGRARERLAAEAGRTPLAVFMALQLQDAVVDLGSAVSLDELFERFIGWTRTVGRGPEYDNGAGQP